MQRDAAVLLYGNGIAGILISLLTSSFLVFAFSDPDSFKQMWWFGMISLLGLRLVDLFWWKTKLQRTEFVEKNQLTILLLARI